MIILLEGPDGTGKSTICEDLASKFRTDGKTALVQAFPSKNGPVGRFIRDELFTGKTKIDERAMLPLMMADAIDFDRRIEEWDEEYDVVILDRHTLVSAFAYQLGPWSLAEIGVLTELTNMRPDTAFILDVPPEEAMRRRKERGGEQNLLYEKDLEYAKTLRERYHAYYVMMQPIAPVFLVPALMGPDEIATNMYSLLSEGDHRPSCSECNHPVSAHKDGQCSIFLYNPTLQSSTRCECSL